MKSPCRHWPKIEIITNPFLTSVEFKVVIKDTRKKIPPKNGGLRVCGRVNSTYVWHAFPSVGIGSILTSHYDEKEQFSFAKTRWNGKNSQTTFLKTYLLFVRGPDGAIFRANIIREQRKITSKISSRKQRVLLRVMKSFLGLLGS